MSVYSYINNMSWEEKKNLAEIIAFLCAAGFFLYKLRSGYLIVNLSLKVSCSRHRSAATNKNYLVLEITLSKGDRGTLIIYDVKAKITCQGKKGEIYLVKGIERLTNKDKKVIWKLSSGSQYLNMTPGEEASFSCFYEISDDRPYRVEVVVFGRKKFSRKTGQWRASCVSLPN